MRRWVVLSAIVAAALMASGCKAGRPAAAVADLEIITHGDKVDLASHLAQGKYTVVDFYAAWCPPCRVIGPALERLAAAESERLAIRKVDIVDWTMPVAEQYQIESLPHLMLYGPDGRQLADGDAVYPALRELFGAAAREVLDAAQVGDEEAPPGTPAKDAEGHTVL